MRETTRLIGSLEPKPRTHAQGAALADDPSWSCQQAYFDCLRGSGIDLEKDYRKRCVQAGLASLPSASVVRSIGEAARMGLLPFDHPAMAELVDFLRLVSG